MSEFKFEYELNPASRAAAALDNEEQRISDELEQARHSFRAELQRILVGSAIILSPSIAAALYGFQRIKAIWLLAVFVYVGLRVLSGRGGGVPRLMAFARTAKRARKELADWNAIRHELSSASNQGSEPASCCQDAVESR